MQLVHDYSPTEFRNNVMGLAKLGKAFNLRTVLTTSLGQGPNGPFIPEVVSLFPDVPVIDRPGFISAWDDPKFVAAKMCHPSSNVSAKPVGAAPIIRRYIPRRAFMSVLFLLVFCLYPLFTARAAQQLEEAPQLAVPPSDNDWTYYCDTIHKLETTDHLKCILLGAKTQVSLSGELRNRGECFDHIDLGTNSASSGYLLQRYTLTAGLTLGDRFRILSTFQSGLENGRYGGPRASVDEDRLFVHEAFLQVRDRREESSIDLRLGRQDLSFGAGRLIGFRELPREPLHKSQIHSQVE
jgi:hypothetical protein